MLLCETPAHLGDVFALIAVLREFCFTAQCLQIARLQRAAEIERLRVVGAVVNIILALDLIADRLQHGGKGVAEGCAARIADVDRADRIRADEFDLHLDAGALVAVAVLLAAFEDFGHRICQPTVSHEHVDEAGAGDLDSGKWEVGFLKALGDEFGELAGRHLGLLGCDQGHISREVAHVRARRIGELYLGQRQLPDALSLRRLLQRSLEFCDDSVPYHCLAFEWWIGVTGQKSSQMCRWE